MDHQTDDDRIAGVARWLIGEARLSLGPLELIDRFCHQLVEFGVPLWRLRAGQRLANPLASERLDESDLFAALDRYFEAVVEAVRGGGGDVLKFLGDGVLAIFPVDASRTDACRAALKAVAAARKRLTGAMAANGTPLAFIATLHVGQVVYGNIGSPDRLDFTVLGPAVNLVSRLEGLAKELDRPLLCSAAFAAALDAPLASLGRFALKGVTEPEEVFAPAAPDGGPGNS